MDDVKNDGLWKMIGDTQERVTRMEACCCLILADEQV